ncbi:hypothetical protein [Amycolatopsis minnesotensis]|uniref:Uncharacterized protein n=1 Tax=Amycolatopsis minnesotensis TaxID=337894 RepID=A0ABP5DN98_9PSEU
MSTVLASTPVSSARHEREFADSCGRLSTLTADTARGHEIRCCLSNIEHACTEVEQRSAWEHLVLAITG